LAGLTGGYRGRDEKRLSLQRRASGGFESSAAPAVPLIVHDVLRSPGQSLDNATCDLMELRFGHDFREVRIHTDAQAAKSAQAVNALAFTVGNNIVFGAGRFEPGKQSGQELLAHELAHVMQQRCAAATSPHDGTLVVDDPSSAIECEADRIADGTMAPPTAMRSLLLQRRSIFAEIAGLFRGDTFDATELKEYLDKIDKTGKIEDFTDSDNKARAIARAWSVGKGGYQLTPRLRVLLIKEMQSGFTGDDDEQAILLLLERSDNPDLSTMFGSAGLNAANLLSDFNGAERDRLLKFYDDRFEGGSEAALKGSTKLKPRAEKFGGEQVEVRDAAEAAEVRRIMQDIKTKYGIDLKSEQGIQGLKNRYTQVPETVRQGLKTRVWHLDELKALERALQHYEPILGGERTKSTRAGAAQEVTNVSKIEQSIDVNTPAGVLDTTTMGEYFGDVTNFSLFKAAEGKSGDFPGDVPKQLEGTIVHEIAHGVLRYQIPTFVSRFKYWKDQFTRDADPVTRIANKNVEAPITTYGTTNAGEDLSETAMFFFVEPNTLKNGRGQPKRTPGNPCPERFKFMEETVKNWKPKAKPPKGKKA
jgi:hypothetical protein